MDPIETVSAANYEMPVAVGVVIAIMFLVAFSGWFFHLFEGWKEYSLDDKYFGYRIGSATFLSMVVIFITFIAMATIYKCPGKQSTTGMKLLSGINCEAYYKLDTSLEGILSAKNRTD